MKITKKNPSVHVTLFGAPRCPWCAKAKAFLKRHGVGHRYVDVLKDPLAKSQCNQHGCFQIPVVVVGRRWMCGFYELKLKKELGIKG
ncbi:glutaredoxin family protein [Sulfurospirillum sp. T05]|uniref:Glutaredoxin family protein n=1 Tax=Sulfurospirillum tamanense TaxID=2813362 RepID=A0ABS2WT90_9BACT|nr:glutaredoxin family protein [Sulfurospirillum tamanensis]MBN2964852.1 glutaredoxin family protein [Sulfurospirillum tamanensis]